MRRHNGAPGFMVVMAGVAMALSMAAIAPAAEFHARTEQRHEFAGGHGPVGAKVGVVIGQGPDGPQDITVRHEIGLRGVPQVPAGPAPSGLGPLGQDGSVTLPNLAPLPPYDVYVGQAEQPQGPVWSNLGTLGGGQAPTPRALRFTTTIQNRGTHSFELFGTPWVPDLNNPDVTTTQAYQCVRFDGVMLMGTQRTCLRYNPVGTLTWHAQHRHFHINGFGRYELRRDRAGHPDMSPAGIVGKSQKLGWCVSDMWNWRQNAPADDPVSELGDTAMEAGDRSWYSECTSAVLYTGASWRQGISPGWADTYPAGYTGQEIPLKGVADGVYWIVTTINPKDNGFGLTIRETTWADNTSAGKVRIYDGGRKAQLLGPLPAKPYSDWYETPPDQPGQ